MLNLNVTATCFLILKIAKFVNNIREKNCLLLPLTFMKRLQYYHSVYEEMHGRCLYKKLKGNYSEGGCALHLIFMGK